MKYFYMVLEDLYCQLFAIGLLRNLLDDASRFLDANELTVWNTLEMRGKTCWGCSAMFVIHKFV